MLFLFIYQWTQVVVVLEVMVVITHTRYNPLGLDLLQIAKGRG